MYFSNTIHTIIFVVATDAAIGFVKLKLLRRLNLLQY